jgi:hypothetical protein
MAKDGLGTMDQLLHANKRKKIKLWLLALCCARNEFFNYLATTKDENGITESNKTYIFLKWSTKE